MQQVETLIGRIFSSTPMCIERVTEGMSTYVYRIVYPHETFYLRILPEEGASFAPEVAVHMQLRQTQVKVPEVIYFEHYYEPLQRSIMVTTEIKGCPVSRSESLHENEMQAVLLAAGRDLARITNISVDGFGWIERDLEDTKHIRAQWPAHRTFALEDWDADLAYLAGNALQASEIATLEQVCSAYNAWLDIEQGYLAHGDFDTTHIYQEHGQYTGIIDFGEIRGASRWYDLAQFHMRDGEHLPYRLLPDLVRGFGEVIPLLATYEQHIRFISVLINVRALARSLQKRPSDRYTPHQLMVLREDLNMLL